MVWRRGSSEAKGSALTCLFAHVACLASGARGDPSPWPTFTEKATPRRSRRLPTGSLGHSSENRACAGDSSRASPGCPSWTGRGERR
eukprot:522937-Rhodomonas_salina.1